MPIDQQYIDHFIAQTHCWPNSTHHLLLTAALGQQQAALTAWDQWLEIVDFEDVDATSYQLYPLVYHQLTSHGVKVNYIIDRLKGVYRYHWSNLHQVAQKADAIFSNFTQQGIPFLVMNALPSAISTHPRLGTRPVHSIDFMVNLEHQGSAIALLKKTGFSMMKSTHKDHMKWAYRLGFKHSTGLQAYLYTSLHPISLGNSFWKLHASNQVSTEFQGYSWPSLSPTDRLFAVLINAIDYRSEPTIEWVVEAHLLISNQQIDWKRLLQLANAYHTFLELCLSFNYLTKLFDLTIPREFMDTLQQQAQPSPTLKRQAQKPIGYMHTLQKYHSTYRQLTQNHPFKQPFGFLDFLAMQWGLPSKKTIPKFLFHMFWNRAK